MPLSYPGKEKVCILCGKPRSWGNKFCSKECKSLSQLKRISLICFGCGKEFQVRPYLKRKTNYCSRKCYWDSTRLKKERFCRVCHKKFIAQNSLIVKGFGIYCSRECQHKTYPKQVKKTCPRCRRIYYVCPAWAPKRTFCSKKCQDDSMRDYVSSVCRKCKKKFDLPRGDLNRGRGNFCSWKCYFTYRGPSTLEEKMERALKLAGIKYRREVKFNRFHADFLIEDKKSVIECDGEYWHLPTRIQERDKRKEKLLSSMGYKVLRFSGKTINKFSDEALAAIVGKSVFG